MGRLGWEQWSLGAIMRSQAGRVLPAPYLPFPSEVPAMSQPSRRHQADSPAVSPAEAAAPPPEGRDAQGRFTANNRFGPGNPFARRTAAFRRAIAEAVTEEMIAAVIAKLTEAALAGDVAAIKLFLAYTVGKPAPAVNPDTLDIEELRQYEQELLPGQTLSAITTRPPAETLVATARITRPHMTEIFAEQLHRGFEALDEADREAAAAAAEEADEENEAAEEDGDPVEAVRREGRPQGRRPAPSGNGGNGGGRAGGKRQPKPGGDGRPAAEWDDRQEPGAAGGLS